MTTPSEKQVEALTAFIDRLLVEVTAEGASTKWKKPWAQALAGVTPTNALTGAVYNGINWLLFGYRALDEGWPTMHFAGLRQWNELGNRVLKGSRGSMGIRPETRYYCGRCKRGTKACLDQSHPDAYVKTAFVGFTVFNHAQTEGDFVPYEPVPHEHNMGWEEWVKALGPTIREQMSDRAYYSKADDTITIPLPDQFVSTNERIATIAHEIGHWTGHSTRTDRLTKEVPDRHSDQHQRGLEEFVAELAGAILSYPFGIDDTTTENTSAYIAGWLTKVRERPATLLHGVSLANQAVAWVNAAVAT